MAELSALNVRITGDASQLEAEMQSAGRAVQGAGAQADRAGRAAGRMGDQMLAAAGQAQAFGNAMRTSGAHTTNLMFQLQDIGVMLAAGQSPLMLAMQQGSQISGVFAQMGTTGTEALLEIGAGFLSMINPLSLATIGIIAGGAALVQWGMSAWGASDATDTFADAVDNASDAMAQIQGQVRTMQQLVTDYAEALASNQTTVANALLQEIELRRRLLAAMRADMEVQLLSARAARQASQERIDDIRREILAVTQRIRANNLVSEQEALLARRQLTQELIDANAQLFAEHQRQGAELDLIEHQVGLIDQAMLSLAASTVETTAQAEALSIAFERAAAAANRMTFGIGLDQESLELPSDQVRQPRARGGGSGPRVNPLIAELEALEQSLLTQEELQVQSFMRQQETLQNALEQRLITQQEYLALMEQAQAMHGERMAELDAYRYGTGLQQAGAFFGDMADAFANGTDEMMRISRAFAATEALINAWRAYSQTLADPSLPFLAKFAAAAKVLGAGLAAVNAIRGGSKTAGGAGGGAGAVAGGGAQPPVQRILIGVTGSGANAVDLGSLIDQINEAGRRGFRIEAGVLRT